MSSINPSMNIGVEPFYDIKVSSANYGSSIDTYWTRLNSTQVNREHILDDTWDQIKDVQSKELRKRLRVRFEGEDGIDAGGVTKEYFQLLSSELFDLSSGTTELERKRAYDPTLYASPLGLWSDSCEDVNWFNSDNDWDLVSTRAG